MNEKFIDTPLHVDLFSKGMDDFGQSPLKFSNSEVNSKANSYYEAGVPSNFIQDGDLIVRVNIIDGYMQSDGFVTGSTGWQINSDGDAEFNSGVFRGALVANSIDIPDTVTANSFHSDNLGNTWWGATSLASAVAKILNTGVATFTNAFITGGEVGGIGITNITNIGTNTADAVPTGLSCPSTTAVVAADGSVSSSVVLTWTAISTSTFDHYIIRFKKASNTYYTYLISNINTVTIEGLVPNTSYNFGIASVNKYGSVSSYSSDISQTTATSTTAPATVTAGSATAGIQYIILEWTHNTETDLASYNIYRNTVNDSSTATLIGNCRTNYFVDGGRTGGTEYFYWVKALNTSGLISASFSTVKSATPRNVTSDDVVTLAGSKVLIDGAVYLSNWRHTSDLTKIDGGDIYASSVTTTQLNFTPVQSTDVIAKINASAEGIEIEADNFTVSGATVFTKKVAGTYDSDTGGVGHVARVRIFPDSSTGLQVIDDAGLDVFKAIVGGTDVGDVIIGAYASDKGVKWDNSAATFTVKGSLITGSGSTINGTYIDSLNVGKLAAGTITSKTVTLAIAAGTGDVYFNAGKTDFTNTDAGFILGLDDSDSDKAKFYIGSSTAYFNWDGTNVVVVGGTITGGTIQTATSGYRVKLNGTNGQLEFLNSDVVLGNVYCDAGGDIIINGTDDVNFAVGGSQKIYMTSAALKPTTGGTMDIGATDKYFNFGYFEDLKVSHGYTGDIYVATTDGGSPTKKLDVEDGIVYDR